MAVSHFEALKQNPYALEAAKKLRGTDKLSIMAAIKGVAAEACMTPMNGFHFAT
jgi:hypothetical protein